MAAISTYKTFLMYKPINNGTEAGSYEKLIDIKNVPAMGADRNTIDVTTLSDDTETMIPGIKRLGDGLQFTCNYDHTAYTTIHDMEVGELEYSFAVYKGGTGSGSQVTPTGTDGIWSFKGKISVGAAEGGVDAAFEMTVTVFPSTAIDFE